MALFHIDGQTLVQLDDVTGSPGREKGLQRLLEANLAIALGARFVASEFRTGDIHGGRIDTLALDEDGSPVIIEYKEYSKSDVIVQGLYYLDWLLDHRGDFEVAARQALSDDEAIDWSQPRLILVAGRFSRYDVHAARRLDSRIEFWQYRYFGEDHITVERLQDESRPTKKAAGGRQPRQPRQKGPGTPELEGLREKLRDGILSLGDDVSEVERVNYVAYFARKRFAALRTGRDAVFVNIALGAVPFNDPQGLVREGQRKGHGLWRFAVDVTDEGQVSYVLELIEQAYQAQR